MPRLKSPPLKARPLSDDEGDAEDDENLYNIDDDEFESYESPTKPSPKSKSQPTIDINTNKSTGIKDPEGQVDDNKGKDQVQGEQEESPSKENEFDGQDIDLETFMNRHNKGTDDSSSDQGSIGSSEVGAENIAPNDPSILRPLVGTTPNPDDHIMMKMSKRLGYSVSAGMEDREISSAGLTQANKKEKKKLKIQTPPASRERRTGYDDNDDDNDDNDNEDNEGDELAETAASLLKRTNAIRNGQSQSQNQVSTKTMPGVSFVSNSDAADGTIDEDPVKKLRQSLLPPHKRDALMDVAEIEKENARKVDALLNSLNLNPLNNKSTTLNLATASKTNKSTEKMSKSAALSHPKSNRKAGQVYGVGAVLPEDLNDHRKQQSSLEHTVASLKKDLRMRDDRLQRLTEHSMLLGNTCDDLKIQVDDLTQRLAKAEAELEAKESRVENAVKAKKKLAKKCHLLEEELKGFTVVQSEYERLKDRETALIEAVQELSMQNEELIEKLKESMKREMEIAQRRVDKIAKIGGGGGGSARHNEDRDRDRDRFDEMGSNSDTSPPRAGGGFGLAEKSNRAHSDSAATRPMGGGKKTKKGGHKNSQQIHFPDLK